MGYLNKETITVDAILTKRGRELLARGANAFTITKFSVADDEIDYGLYNLAHPLGSEFYGSAIENMPVVEASPDETQNLRYKLVTLTTATVAEQGLNVMPTVSLGRGDVILTAGQETQDPITPRTLPGDFDAGEFGYTAVLNDSNIASLSVVQGIAVQPSTPQPSTGLTSTQTAIGRSFKIRAKNVSQLGEATVTFYGNQSGAEASLRVTVNPS